MDEIWDLIDSVSEVFSTYSYMYDHSNVSPTCIKLAPRNNYNVVANDMCLLNTCTFQYVCPFRGINSCLLNIDCLLNRGGQENRFFCSLYSLNLPTRYFTNASIYM